MAANDTSRPTHLRTIAEVQDAYVIGASSPTAFVQSCLDNAGTSSLNAFITVCGERALTQARAAEAELARSGPRAFERQPLLGVPIAIKDNLALEGVRTTCASKILGDYVSPYTATCVERLERAGAVILGKLNLDEFAMGGSNENSAFGPVRHPTHPDRVPGGSSGGSAAAVRAGLCVAALGSDTGGSVRLPASYCGVVGLKPTYGTISRFGLVAFASSLDQVGPVTHSVADAARLLEVMAGPDPLDSTSSSRAPERLTGFLQKPFAWTGVRIGVPEEYFVAGLAPAVEQATRNALSWMEAQGARLVPLSLPHTASAVAVYYLVAVSEASSNLARYDGVRYGSRPPEAVEARDLDSFYEKVRAQFGPEVKRRILLGTFALSSGYSEAYYRKACQVRRLIRDDFETAFTKVDFIASPVAPTTAFKLGEKISDPLQMYLNDIFTIPANLAGLPALSVPCGSDAEGLPVGLHLMAPPFAEGPLLALAQAFEKGRN